MTLVAGQQFFQGMVLIADSRASIIKHNKIIPWRDNTQKLFRLKDHMFIGFAGDIEFAGTIISFLLRQIKERPRLGNLNIFYSKGPKLIKYAYNILSDEFKEKRKVGFMIGGIDFNRPEPVKDKTGKITQHLAIYDKKLFKISCPEFVTEKTSTLNPFLIMGSGEPAIEKNEADFKKLVFGEASNLKLLFSASIMEFSLRRAVKKLGIDSVGGLYQTVIIGPNGSEFLQYKSKNDLESTDDELDVEMIVRGDRFIQRNLKTGKEIPLLFPPEVLKIKDPSTDLFADLENN